jgi:hypothetical protein
MAGYSYGYSLGGHQDPNGGSGYCISQTQHHQHPTYPGQQQQHGYAVNGGDHLPHHQIHPHHHHHTMVYADELTSEGEYSTPPLTATGSGGQSATASAFSLISGDVEELNTRDLAQRISQELKRYSIPQAIFAQKVLCRSQGTLSDLLRNPKPWSKLKSGRETFRRMAKWLQEPEYQRMSALRIAGRLLQPLVHRLKRDCDRLAIQSSNIYRLGTCRILVHRFKHVQAYFGVRETTS